MSKRKYTYDGACESLSAHFLAGKRVSETDVWELAQAIQDAVEEWFADQEEPSPSDENIPNVPFVIDGEQP